MSKFQERRCRECGRGIVRLVAEPGRRTTYRFLELDVPVHVAIPTCDHCGMDWHNDTTAEVFDEAMEQVFRAELVTIAHRALERIDAAGVRQSDVERAIDLSPGYLSKIKRGERAPEPMPASGATGGHLDEPRCPPIRSPEGVGHQARELSRGGHLAAY